MCRRKEGGGGVLGVRGRPSLSPAGIEEGVRGAEGMPVGSPWTLVFCVGFGGACGAGAGGASSVGPLGRGLWGLLCVH